MKRILFALAVVFAAIACQREYPQLIRIEGGKLHVQGIALDRKNDCMYCSFTSAFFKTDLEGNITGSVTGINGHLGAMTFDPVGRKVYASLEFKDDAIGKGIAKTLGAEVHKREESRFYVAEIDVDKITGLDMDFNEVVKLHAIDEAGKDYLEKVEVEGCELEHRYGCSGIDGVTIGPAFGSGSGKNDHLYVAYGIYGDNKRTDNDYNIILCYSLKDLSKPLHKYFVFTGNTMPSTMDASNVKRFWSPVVGGGEWAVFVDRTHSAELTKVTVYHRSAIISPNTVGVQSLTIS